MASTHYFTDADGSNVTYMESAPVPLPTPAQERDVSVRKTLTGKEDSGVLVNGVSIVTDMGGGIAEMVMDFPVLSIGNYWAMRAKYDALETVIYSPDGGTSTYVLAWKRFAPRHHPGRADYEATMEFYVITENISIPAPGGGGIPVPPPS